MAPSTADALKQEPALIEQLVKFSEESGDSGWHEWKRLREGVKVFYRTTPDSVVHQVLAVGEEPVEASAQELYEFLSDFVLSLKSTDDMFREDTAKVVEKLREGPQETVEVRYAVFSVPWPFWHRSMLWFDSTKILKDGTVVSMGRSIEREDTPEESNYVRSELMMSGYVCRPIPGEPKKCRIAYVVQVDPKGWLPKFAVNWASASQAMNVARLDLGL
eukprot:tig00021105_g18263.t1